VNNLFRAAIRLYDSGFQVHTPTNPLELHAITENTRKNIIKFYNYFLMTDFMEIIKIHVNASEIRDFFDMVRGFLFTGKQIADLLGRNGLCEKTFVQVVDHLRKYRYCSFEELLFVAKTKFPNKLKAEPQQKLSLERNRHIQPQSYEVALQANNKLLVENMNTITKQKAKITKQKELMKFQDERRNGRIPWMIAPKFNPHIKYTFTDINSE
jgi:hypothetical protein